MTVSRDSWKGYFNHRVKYNHPDPRKQGMGVGPRGSPPPRLAPAPPSAEAYKTTGPEALSGPPRPRHP